MFLSVAWAATLTVGESGHLFVEAQLGEGEPSVFLLDSGASVTVLHPDLVDELDVMREINVAGAGGSVTGTLVRSVPLTVGGKTVELPYALAMPLDDIQDLEPRLIGVLGIDVLRQGVVRLDPAAGTIEWWVERPEADPLKLKRGRGGLLVAPLEVPGGRVPGIVDFGAHGTIVNTAAALWGFTSRNKAGTGSGIDGTEIVYDQAEAELCTLGARLVNPCVVEVSDLPVFETLRMHRSPAAIVGLDVLGAGPVVLEAKRKRMWLE